MILTEYNSNVYSDYHVNRHGGSRRDVGGQLGGCCGKKRKEGGAGLWYEAGLEK